MKNAPSRRHAATRYNDDGSLQSVESLRLIHVGDQLELSRREDVRARYAFAFASQIQISQMIFTGFKAFRAIGESR